MRGATAGDEAIRATARLSSWRGSPLNAPTTIFVSHTGRSSAWMNGQRAYIDAQISMPRNAARRVAAIAKLRDSLSDFAREQYAWRGYPQAALDAMVVVILGDAEQRQRLQWEPSGVPARRYGIGKRLRRWFGSRSTKLTEDEVASDLPRPFLRDEDALGAMATTDDVEGGALFRALGVNLLTQAQQAVVRLRAAGWDDAEIAKCLGIEPVTVRIHARDAAKRLARFLNEPTHRPSGKH